MSIPTIQNAFHSKIELSFPSTRVRPTPKTITLGARTFGGLHNFREFSVQALSERYHTPCSLREKNEAKRKSINFSFNFIFIVEQTIRKVPRKTLLN